MNGHCNKQAQYKYFHRKCLVVKPILLAAATRYLNSLVEIGLLNKISRKNSLLYEYASHEFIPERF